MMTEEQKDDFRVTILAVFIAAAGIFTYHANHHASKQKALDNNAAQVATPPTP